MVSKEGGTGDDAGGSGADTSPSCSEETEVCLTLSGGSLYYSSSADIYSFSITHSGCVTGASGGDTEANGLMVYNIGGTISGSSVNNARYIPAGNGVLIDVEGEVTQECLIEASFVGENGAVLISEIAQGATAPTGASSVQKLTKNLKLFSFNNFFA